MKARFTIALTLLILTAATLAADPGGQRRTIIVKDGKVITDTDEVLDLSGDLLRGKRAFLGVGLLDLTPGLREHFGATKTAGILIESVSDGSPAEKAGLRVGDIILSIDGKEIDSAWDLRGVLRDKREGDSVRVDYLRGRARQTAVATVVERDMPALLNVIGGMGDLEKRLGRTFSGPEWRARVESLSDCDALQTKLKDLETRMKELERKLAK